MLPDHWTAAIFRKLALRYGHKWNSMYPQEMLGDAMAEWSLILGGLEPDDIKRGLDGLGAGYAPDVYEFRDLCLRNRRAGCHRMFKKLPPPMCDPAVVEGELSAIRKIIGKSV